MGNLYLKYFDFVRNASIFFALIIAFWIPSYRWVLSDFIVAWLLFSILQLKYYQRFKLNLNNRFNSVLFVLQLIIFFGILSEIVSADAKNIIIKNSFQKISLLIFPMLFALSGKDFKIKKDLFLKLFVLSNIVMALICLGVATYHALSFDKQSFLVYNHTVYGYSFYRQSFLSVFHHRSYFSMFIVFSVAIIFFLKEKKSQDFYNTFFKKVLFWIVFTFFCLMIFLLESRAGSISLVLLLFWLFIQKLILTTKTIDKMFVLFSVLVLVLFLISNKRIKHTFNQISNSEKKSKSIASKSAPERLILWKSAIEIIYDNFWKGIGIEQFHQKFNETYLKNTGKSKDFVMRVNYNVHNQFVEEFVLYGVLGFLLLISLFIYPIIISFKRKNYLFLSFLLITGFNFLFESMLDTIAGIVFFAFFFNYFIFVFNDKKTNLS